MVCLMSLVTVIIQGIILRPLALTPQTAPRATAMFHHRVVCRDIWPMWPLGVRLTLTAGLRSLCKCVLVLIGLASICDCCGRSNCWIGRGDEPVDAPLDSVAPLHADFATLSHNCRKLPMMYLSLNCRGLPITTLSNNCRRLPMMSL